MNRAEMPLPDAALKRVERERVIVLAQIERKKAPMDIFTQGVSMLMQHGTAGSDSQDSYVANAVRRTYSLPDIRLPVEGASLRIEGLDLQFKNGDQTFSGGKLVVSEVIDTPDGEKLVPLFLVRPGLGFCDPRTGFPLQARDEEKDRLIEEAKGLFGYAQAHLEEEAAK